MRIAKAIAKLVLGKRLCSRLKEIWHKRIDEKLLCDPRMDPILKKMMLSYRNGILGTMTSRYWITLNRHSLTQLLKMGFENFKQTVALSYFAWLVDKDDLQLEFLKENLEPDIVTWAREKSKTSKQPVLFTPKQSQSYNFRTLMLWRYVQQQIDKNIPDRLEEPLIGNPPAIELNGKWISSDLANSILDFQSISSGVGNFRNINTVLELGAGYGRTAYVILRLKPHLRYIIVDLPPALYISQCYLSKVFPDKKIFTFKDFDNFSDVEDEFYKSDIILLMPDQLKNIPDKTVDLFLAIDCLHEMRPEQIEFYFNVIDRLAKRFYFSCFKKTTIPDDGITLEEKSYPIRSHWSEVFWQTRRVQTNFFEAFFFLGDQANNAKVV